MAPAPGQRTDAESGHGGPVAAVGRFVGFAITAGVAMAILAAVVLLPAWQRMRLAQADRDRLAARCRANEQIIDLRRGEAEAIKTDPLQTRRILMETRNYRAPGESSVTVAGGQATGHLERLLQPTGGGVEIDPAFNRAATRVQVPRVRSVLLIASGVILTLATACFMPSEASRSRRKSA